MGLNKSHKAGWLFLSDKATIACVLLGVSLQIGPKYQDLRTLSLGSVAIFNIVTFF